MLNPDTDFFLRIGGSTESKYLKKALLLFSGLIIKANIFESAPGMFRGICLGLSNLNKSKGYILDPVTYVFALDPNKEWSIRSWQKINKDKADDKLRTDLRLLKDEAVPDDWKRHIKDPNDSQKNKIEIRGFNRAYRKLADAYFEKPLVEQVGRRQLEITDFDDDNALNNFVKNVIDYQYKALTLTYDLEKYKQFHDQIPKPAKILSPYFNIDTPEWLTFNLKIWDSFEKQVKSSESSIVVQTSIDFLRNNFGSIYQALLSTKSSNIFLWLEGFEEEKASESEIETFVNLIISLSNNNKRIYNLYSGGLSMLLIPFGLKGIVNNPGYGMRRPLEPVKGGIPTAQFYLPTQHTRNQISITYDLLVKHNLGNSAEEFLKDVCSCSICKYGIKQGRIDLVGFYNELGFGTEEEKRYPSPRAIERCAFHFMFARLAEYKWALNATKGDVINRLNNEIAIWGSDTKHLSNWKNVLEKYSR